MTNAVFYIGTGSHHLLQLNTLSKTPRAKSYTRKALLSWLEKQGWFRLYSKGKKEKKKRRREKEERLRHGLVTAAPTQISLPCSSKGRGDLWRSSRSCSEQQQTQEHSHQPRTCTVSCNRPECDGNCAKMGTSHGKLAGALDLSRTISAGWKLSFSSQLFRTRSQDMVPLGCNEGTSIFLPKQSTETSISFNIIWWKRIRGPA